MPPRIVSTVVNEFDGKCPCGKEVPAGEGFASLVVDGRYKRWVTRCSRCTPLGHKAMAQAHFSRTKQESADGY